MLVKTLLEVRNIAQRTAESRGHKIKRWNRRHGFRYTAVCSVCRARLVVYSRTIDGSPDPTENPAGGNLIVARDRDRYWTGLDFNWAEGNALKEACWSD